MSESRSTSIIGEIENNFLGDPQLLSGIEYQYQVIVIEHIIFLPPTTTNPE